MTDTFTPLHIQTARNGVNVSGVIYFCISICIRNAYIKSQSQKKL